MDPLFCCGCAPNNEPNDVLPVFPDAPNALPPLPKSPVIVALFPPKVLVVWLAEAAKGKDVEEG